MAAPRSMDHLQRERWTLGSGVDTDESLTEVRRSPDTYLGEYRETLLRRGDVVLDHNWNTRCVESDTLTKMVRGRQRVARQKRREQSAVTQSVHSIIPFEATWKTSQGAKLNHSHGAACREAPTERRDMKHWAEGQHTLSCKYWQNQFIITFFYKIFSFYQYFEFRNYNWKVPLPSILYKSMHPVVLKVMNDKSVTMQHLVV